MKLVKLLVLSLEIANL